MPQPAIAYQYLERSSAQSFCPLTLSVEENDCLVVAQSIVERTGQPVCVLNMANAIYVGGDYLTGKGQEESLIQRTDLLESLLQLDGVKSGTVYHLANRLGFNTDSCVGFGEFTCLYSADVVVNRLNEYESLGEQAFKINVISSAAYNLANDGASMGREHYIAGTFFKIINQLRTAKLHGQRHLVLGAFGCGAFQNDPQLIAMLYHCIINEFEFQGCFETICFVIKPTYSCEENSNYAPFVREFKRPPAFLYDLLHEAFLARNNIPVLDSMLVPLDTISSVQELCLLATRLIANELQKLASDPQKNKYKINFFTHLEQLLRAQPNHAREILASALQSPQCMLLTPDSGFFKGVKNYLIKKLENLLARTPLSPPGFLPEQIQLAEDTIQQQIM